VSTPIRFEEFELDVSAYELRRAGDAVKLERIPMELLMFLAANPGRLILRSELVDRIWGKNHFLQDESAINTAVRKLRAALEDNAEKPRYRNPKGRWRRRTALYWPCFRSRTFLSRRGNPI